MSAPFLSICYPTYHDFEGLCASVEDILISHPEICNEIEIVVVDNDPEKGSRFQTTVETWCKTVGKQVSLKYVHMPSPQGVAPAKQRCVDESSGEFVLVLDSHVRIMQGMLARLIEFFKKNRFTKDLYTGPMVYTGRLLKAFQGFDLDYSMTYQSLNWRKGAYGTWVSDPRAHKLDAPSFEVPSMAGALFACRREIFCGFCKELLGFGGNDYYLAVKTKKRGDRVVCLPFLRWHHRFERAARIPYPVSYASIARNYIISHKELGIPLDDMRKHYVEEEKKLSEEQWEALVDNPNILVNGVMPKELPKVVKQPQVDKPQVKKQPPDDDVFCKFYQLEPGIIQCSRCKRQVRTSKPPESVKLICPRSGKELPPFARMGKDALPGVGQELKRLLKKCCIKDNIGCQCDAHARLMDSEGPDWCEQNIDTIVRWMKEAAEKRGLLKHTPFKDKFAKKLVKRAIRNTRRKLALLNNSSGNTA